MSVGGLVLGKSVLLVLHVASEILSETSLEHLFPPSPAGPRGHTPGIRIPERGSSQGQDEEGSQHLHGLHLEGVNKQRLESSFTNDKIKQIKRCLAYLKWPPLKAKEREIL